MKILRAFFLALSFVFSAFSAKAISQEKSIAYSFELCETEGMPPVSGVTIIWGKDGKKSYSCQYKTPIDLSIDRFIEICNREEGMPPVSGALITWKNGRKSYSCQYKNPSDPSIDHPLTRAKFEDTECVVGHTHNFNDYFTAQERQLAAVEEMEAALSAYQELTAESEEARQYFLNAVRVATQNYEQASLEYEQAHSSLNDYLIAQERQLAAEEEMQAAFSAYQELTAESKEARQHSLNAVRVATQNYEQASLEYEQAHSSLKEPILCDKER